MKLHPITFAIIFLVIIIILFCSSSLFFRKNPKTEMIQILTRQAARWSTAATQDSNPLVKVLHANYGAAYLWALKDIATDDEIKKATNINIIRFRNEIIKIQDDATKKMIKICPDYAPEETYLTGIAGE